jgi:hypothetical protein
VEGKLTATSCVLGASPGVRQQQQQQQHDCITVSDMLLLF